MRDPEDRKAFIQENGIELTDEQLEDISGGKRVAGAPKRYPKSKKGYKWVSTGRTRPATIWRNIWPDYECRCTHCGALDWDWFKN